ncbi:MAG: translation initiation factor IF-3 [Parcubacteria group bacterium]|nr:translation initiation factor IF-3 [Parcubacteria group bacterium]
MTQGITNRINNQITAPELRVIDEAGKNIGILTREEALRMAQEKGLDLIEIAPTAKPPVARIISFDKFRYQKEKELKKQRVSQKAQALKHIRISGRAAMNDLQMKAEKINEFLNESHPVEIQMVLKGREKANRAWARQKLEQFLKLIDPEYKIMSPIKSGGRGFTVTVVKKL